MVVILPTPQPLVLAFLLCSLTHHWEQSQRMETPLCVERQSFISQVLQLLLSLMQHLHAFCILIL